MKPIIKSILISCLFVFSMQIVSAQDADKTVSITVSGSGKTQDDAKQSALRSAIEQAFGAFISSKTEILNDQVIADQIASVANGNIQSFSILNESQLPDGSWGITLKAIVSVNKLTSFVESKGIAVEIKGGLFALNIKQQILNEQAEIKAVSEMVGMLHEPMQISFDYSIKSSEPKALDADNKNWRIDLSVQAIANKNMDFCANYLIKTLTALGLSKEEVEDYHALNKQVFPVKVNYQGVIKSIYLRKQNSISALLTLTSQWKFYTNLFYAQSELGDFSLPANVEDYDKFGTIRIFSKNDKEIPFRMNFLTQGEVAAVYNWSDDRTLNQISEMTGYKVIPEGILSPYKYGGICFVVQPTYYQIGVDINGNELIEVALIGAARKAGLKKGDKIISINDIKDINRTNIADIINKSEKIDKLCEFVILRNTDTFKFNVYPVKVPGYALVSSIIDLGPMDWNSAKIAVEDLNLNGYDDWRLPTLSELKIMDKRLYMNKIGGLGMRYLDSRVSRPYWSSDELIEVKKAGLYHFNWSSDELNEDENRFNDKTGEFDDKSKFEFDEKSRNVFFRAVRVHNLSN